MKIKEKSIMPIADSELILNPDGSIYHLNLLPGDLAEIIITVGDQERVKEVSKHFSKIEVEKQKREFTCCTGLYKDKRISVISTGIGTDNIDIVFNEIDALFNIDFKKKTIKEDFTRLKFIRLGTSGCIQSDIDLDQILISEVAVGIDNMNLFYNIDKEDKDQVLEKILLESKLGPFNLYAVKGDSELIKAFTAKSNFILGSTLTSIGFYGPQGRKLRGRSKHDDFINNISEVKWNNKRLTNLEMETSGIYLLAANLGHSAISINALLANRQKGTFSLNPKKTVDKMILKSLDIIAEL